MDSSFSLATRWSRSPGMSLAPLLMHRRFLLRLVPLSLPRLSLSFPLFFLRFLQGFRDSWVDVFQAICVVHNSPPPCIVLANGPPTLATGQSPPPRSTLPSRTRRVPRPSEICYSRRESLSVADRSANRLAQPTAGREIDRRRAIFPI